MGYGEHGLRLVQSKHAIRGDIVMYLSYVVIKPKGEVSHKVEFSLEYEFFVSIF